jgi:hypothetical protein
LYPVDTPRQGACNPQTHVVLEWPSSALEPRTVPASFHPPGTRCADARRR